METRDLLHDEIPRRIQSLESPPTHFSVAGDIDPGRSQVIAFVGARNAYPESLTFIEELAYECARLGAVVVSGGALGVDAAAHRGALNAKGRTWSVMGCGRNYTSPPENKDLLEEIRLAAGCALIWPFEPDRKPGPQNFLARNRILVGLADLVVVGQASVISGSRSSASVARKTRKPLWVVPGPPWLPNFMGSLLEIEAGAKIVLSHKHFLSTMFGEDYETNPRKTPSIAHRSPEEIALLEAASERPEHLDELCDLAGLSLPSAATALLTLALEHVLVEGPPGYYRRG